MSSPACRAASGTRSRALARPDSGMSAWASLWKAADSSRGKPMMRAIMGVMQQRQPD
jgi:hypothetical protein